MYGKIPKLFDCLADPVVHLLLLKGSLTQQEVSLQVQMISRMTGLDSVVLLVLKITTRFLVWLNSNHPNIRQLGRKIVFLKMIYLSNMSVDVKNLKPIKILPLCSLSQNYFWLCHVFQQSNSRKYNPAIILSVLITSTFDLCDSFRYQKMDLTSSKTPLCSVDRAMPPSQRTK